MVAATAVGDPEMLDVSSIYIQQSDGQMHYNQPPAGNMGSVGCPVGRLVGPFG